MWLVNAGFRRKNNAYINHINRNRKTGATFTNSYTFHECVNTSYVFTHVNIFSLSIFSAQQSVQQGPQANGPIATAMVVGGKKQQRQAKTRRRGLACALAYRK